MKNNLVLGSVIGAAALIVVVVGFTIVKPTLVINQVSTSSLGAGANSPAVVGGCADFNGESLCGYSQEFGVGSTTCAFAPQVASSTLISASVRVKNTRGDALAIEFGKGKIQATTTTFGYVTGISTGQVIVASTTANNSTFFSLGDFLNVKVGSTTFSGTGTCTALFRSI